MLADVGSLRRSGHDSLKWADGAIGATRFKIEYDAPESPIHSVRCGFKLNRLACPAIVAALFASPLFAGQPSADERAVWSLEDTYWRYVQTGDLEHYRTLWHSDFLGWPLTNPEPVHKEHITDWIDVHTSIGETLKSYDLERLAAQATGNYVTVAYRIRLTWVGKDGADKPSTIRVIHTWLRDASRKWQIISGMAAPPNALGH